MLPSRDDLPANRRMNRQRRKAGLSGEDKENLLPQERVAHKAFAVVGIRGKEVDHGKVISPKLGDAEAQGLYNRQPLGGREVRIWAATRAGRAGWSHQRSSPWRGPSTPAIMRGGRCGGQLATLPS